MFLGLAELVDVLALVQRVRLQVKVRESLELFEVIVSGSSLPMPNNSSNSSGSVDVDACARDPAFPIASLRLGVSSNVCARFGRAKFPLDWRGGK